MKNSGKNTGKEISTFAMEPLMPEVMLSGALTDEALLLAREAKALEASLPPQVAVKIADLVRAMNCYYSNLIEGHDTHPRDIERALHNQWSCNKRQKDLQKEAIAHIALQEKIDNGELPFSISTDYLQRLHLLFYEHLPDSMREIKDSQKTLRVKPGHLREEWVQVGEHVAPEPDRLSTFLDRFSEAYDVEKLGPLRSIVAVAASHHRLLWIHPFLDGNGRVARLFSHAFLRYLEVGSGLWSISRGLARNNKTYKALLANADNPRQGDLDGRGSLSHRALLDFCDFFIKAARDQVNFMSQLIAPEKLRQRVEQHIVELEYAKKLQRGSSALMREVLHTGSLARGQAANVTGYQERQARSVLSGLLKQGLLTSDTPRSPVFLNISLDVVERWLPGLYPMDLKK